jgi:hypothetical protein
MVEQTDLGKWVWTTLKATTAITDLLVAGADAVLESGELSAKALAAWNKERLETPALQGRALAVLVVDTGEQKKDNEFTATCSIFIYDRGSASPYSSIRAMREAVLTALLDQNVLLPRGAVIVSTKYSGRTGHDVFVEFDLDFERVDLNGPIVTTSPDVYG